ncbi:MAG: hypothetical protein K6D94_02840, partial [Clostridiales bacterium]|nr:hypothetical protein [Clostridiales bacterium]
MVTRRCLSLMLVICMCISVIPFMTFADDIPFIEIPEPAEDLSGEPLTPDVEPSGTDYPVIGEPVMTTSAAVSGEKIIVTETRYVFLDTVFADKGVLTADRSSASAGDIVTLALTTAAYYGLTEN